MVKTDPISAWLRICFAEGPRQAINALTLYSVMRADLVPTGSHAAKDGHTPVVQFFVNLQILAGTEKEQAAILFGMLFTLVIWVFSALSLMLAVIFYIVFLWHHIREGSLSKYCRRKVDTRLHKIVMVRVNKALEKDIDVRPKQEIQGSAAGRLEERVKRQPTLPNLNTGPPQNCSPISRQNTQTEDFPFQSRPSTPVIYPSAELLSRAPTVPDVLAKPFQPQPPSRATTQSSLRSNISYGDDIPLTASAGAMGYGHPGIRTAPSRANSAVGQPGPRPLQSRSFTASSLGSQRSFEPSASRMGAITRTNTDSSGRTTPGSHNFAPQLRKPIPQDLSLNGAPGQHSGPSTLSRRPNQEYEMQIQPPTDSHYDPPTTGEYVAFNPHVHSTTGAGYPGSAYGRTPLRNFTLPQRPPRNDYFGPTPLPQRSGTAPVPETTSISDTSGRVYGSPWQPPPAGPVPYRSASAGLGGL